MTQKKASMLIFKYKNILFISEYYDSSTVLFNTMTTITGLSSRRQFNDGNAIPCVGFGVYNSTPGPETEQAVLWALEVKYYI